MALASSTALPILCLAIARTGSAAYAEGGDDHRLFLRYVESPVAEVAWKPSESQVIYTGPPANKEERYRVIPCVVRMPPEELLDAPARSLWR